MHSKRLALSLPYTEHYWDYKGIGMKILGLVLNWMEMVVVGRGSYAIGSILFGVVIYVGIMQRIYILTLVSQESQKVMGVMECIGGLLWMGLECIFLNRFLNLLFVLT